MLVTTVMEEAALAEYGAGERVEVDISAGIVTSGGGTPDWQTGVVEERLPNGFYRVKLDAPISGRTAEKEAAPEHIRRRGGAASA